MALSIAVTMPRKIRFLCEPNLKPNNCAMLKSCNCRPKISLIITLHTCPVRQRSLKEISQCLCYCAVRWRNQNVEAEEIVEHVKA